MRNAEVCHAWVVYRMTLHSGATAGNVVCEQREWEVLDRLRPGFHTLLHSGLKTEQEAEKLARGSAGETRPKPPRKKRTPPASPVPRCYCLTPDSTR